MKRITVSAAALGYGLLEKHGLLDMAGLRFEPAESVFPAVTCVAQATLRTGLPPAAHGMVSNGAWIDELCRPLFWEQSSRLVKGTRVWGEKDGVYFFQQSFGENVSQIVSPAPIHKHGGGMVMSCYTKPAGMAKIMEKLCGKFPLWRYWGPLASPKVGRKCIDWFEAMTDVADVETAYLYLPTLDYAAQKDGPDSSSAKSALKEFSRQLERIADIASRRGAELSVVGEYEITPVNSEPVAPNVVLRREDFFRTRTVGGRSYPDFHQSSAFAMCDHEFCLVYGEKREEAAKTLLATGDFERTEDVAPDAVTLLAKSGSWCEYRWWTGNREAPDYASHVDIHNKPGYDPKELFFFNKGIVKGTHGRRCTVAKAVSARG